MLITLARKPLGASTVVQCCLTHGTGALNIDASRIGTGTGEVTTVTVPDHRSGNYGQDTAAYKDRAKLTIQRVDQGRWPANVLLHGEGAKFPDTGKSTGTKNGSWRTGHQYEGGYRGADPNDLGSEVGYGDSGSAARYFKQIGKDDTP